MSGAVSWLLSVDVNNGKMSDLRALMDEMVESTRAESGAVIYEWFVDSDEKSVEIYERYVDSAATLEHLGIFGANFADRFLACASPTSLHVFGNPSSEVKAVTDGLGAAYLSPIGGFARQA